ncbi:TetR/AcrR family transcriptional regulator [Halopseudomonas sabulinigri]|uniref:DNA-binding transcriptional regulator, AcrR family n=1 Tax=Halopseudomonas sabulinigri TaxID=472181 RepID=A0A1H1N3K0_9GAMM|nr:TetR/AcrR family transcriptional regulator [Halopseudomonas sabulinigri]SDR93701.1 DNA-binding transcriptional regulator, AcrR family [Halopseudomonas sabulinigri]
MNTPTTAKRRYRGSAVEERKALRRQQLIDAAIEVYGRNGYRHSGVKQVCDAAGLTQRYFYESFSHSDELLIACYEQAAEQLRENNAAVAEAAGPNPVDRSMAMLRAYFQSLKDHPLIARLLLIEIRGISPAVDRAIDKALHAANNDMARLLVKPGHEGEPVDELLHAGIMGGVIHIALHWMATGYRKPVEEVAATAFKLGGALLEG